jgi:hypothetical protein
MEVSNVFADIVEEVFGFLVQDYGFACKRLGDRAVRYEKCGLGALLTHSWLTEVGITVGLVGSQTDEEFSIGFLAVLDSEDPYAALKSDRELSKTCPMVVEPAQIRAALVDYANKLKKHGQRFLQGDKTVIDDLRATVDAYWRTDQAVAIRARAEEAFANRDYDRAIREYRLLGEQRRRFDTKRMEIAEKRRNAEG